MRRQRTKAQYTYKSKGSPHGIIEMSMARMEGISENMVHLFIAIGGLHNARISLEGLYACGHGGEPW